MTAALLWILLVAAGGLILLAAIKLWQLTQPVEIIDITDETVAADKRADLVIVERVVDLSSPDPTGTETVEVDIDTSDAIESSVPSTDPSTVEADELVLTDPVDVHHHHH